MTMEDREDKLNKAREKLDKFRKKKQKTPGSTTTSKPVDVVSNEDGQSKASNSPTQTPTPTISSPVEVCPSTVSNREEESLTSVIADSFEPSVVPAEPAPPSPLPSVSVEDESNIASYFSSSSISETTPELYIESAVSNIPAEEDNQPQLGSPTVSSEDSSQFSIISTNIENLQETIKRNESFNDNLQILALEQRCAGLEKELSEEREAKTGLGLEVTRLEQEKEGLQSELTQRLAEVESSERSEVARLEAELSARSQTIQLLVGEKSELQAAADRLLGEKERLEETKVSLELSVDQLGSACSELRQQVAASSASSEQQLEVERQAQALQLSLTATEQSYSELQTKLAQVS